MVNKIFFDIDELIENIQKSDFNIYQLSNALSDPKLIVKEINEIIIYYVSIGATIEHQGSFDKDYYGFTFSCTNSNEIHKGNKLTKYSVIMTKPSGQFSGVTINKLESITINIKKEFITNLFGDMDSDIYNFEGNEQIIYFYNLLNQVLNKTITIDDNILEDIILKNIIYLILNIPRKINKINYFDKFVEISQYIHHNINKDLSVQEIAKKFSVTDRTIRNIFSYSIQMSPKQYQKAIKANYLKKMILRDERDSISNSIRSLNFHNQSLLTKDFTTIFDKTPKKYKSFYFQK